MVLQTAFFKDGDLAQAILELDPMNNPEMKELDDIYAGSLFRNFFGNIAVYNTTIKEWMLYNGIVWKPDEENKKVKELTERLQRHLELYVLQNIPPQPTGEQEKYRNYIRKLGDQQKRLKMLEEATYKLSISNDQLDTKLEYLNCKNGELNLRTFQLEEHDPMHYHSKFANVVYVPEASSELWNNFVLDVTVNTDGSLCLKKAKYLQKLIGYSMTADTVEECCYMIYGASTRNGKSTFIETIASIMNEYAMNMNPESLAQKNKNSSGANGDIARLNGCRFLQCSEPPKRMLLDSALLKTLTGRDTVTAREVYQKNFQFKPYFKLIFNTNYLPTINDDTVFSSNRIVVIPFERHFDEKEQDKSLKERLLSEENRSGILNWMVEGLKLYRTEGMKKPDVILESTKKYREDSDKIGNFLNDVLRKGNEKNVIKGTYLYGIYKKWCEANGYYTEGKQSFFKDLREKRRILHERITIDRVAYKNVVVGYTVDPSEE